MRRPIRIARPFPPRPGAPPPLHILGTGPLADALRKEASTHPPDLARPLVVIDAGLSVQEGFKIARSLHAQRPRWITLVGDDGTGSLLSARDAGARTGLSRGLGREWDVKTQIIHLDAWLSPSEAASLVMDELIADRTEPELFIGPGTREVQALVTESFPTTTHLVPDAVVLLTGGTRGVTACVAEAIALRGPCTLVLVGRTLPGATPLNEMEARESLKASLASSGERVTPRMIEDALKPLRTAEEVRQTVERLRSIGAKVEVRSVDLSVERAVQALLIDILDTYGRLDLVVHGAGVEESRKLADKDDASFARVFGPKADGGLYLAENLPSGTFFLSMGSVAGFFGNTGQVDYSAANAAMAALCERRPQSLHVCWTAWGDVGMAVRGGMAALLESRGMSFLPARAGAELTVNLIASGTEGEVIVAGALGDMGAPGWHPWLECIEYAGDGIVARFTLSTESAPYIVDHAIDGVPVLPGVVGLELMVAAALHVCPQGEYLGAEQVHFDAPLKLYREDPVEVEVVAERVEGGVQCRLISSRKTRADRIIRTEHFSALILVEEMPLVTALPAGFLPEEDITEQAIYSRFFHGPRFQVLEGVEAIAIQGLQARARTWDSRIIPGTLTSPLSLEAAFQAAGLHRMVMAGVMALPASMDVVVQHRTVPDGAALVVTAWVREDGRYDVDVDDADGHVLQIRGFKLSDLGPLAEDKRFPSPEGGWVSSGVASVMEAESLPASVKADFSRRGTARRIADRLAGQAAGARALWPLVGANQGPSRAPSGQPTVPGYGVSISHGDGIGVAVVAAGEVGVDVERVENRDGAWLREWFSHEEAQVLGGVTGQAIGWCAREAILKVLGVGMSVSPRDIVITGIHPIQVHVQGEAAQLLGTRQLRLQVGRCIGIEGKVGVMASLSRRAR